MLIYTSQMVQDFFHGDCIHDLSLKENELHKPFQKTRCQLSTKDSDTFTRRKIYSSWWDLSMDSGTIHRWSSIEMFETPPGQLKCWATKTQKPCYFPDFNPGSLIPGCFSSWLWNNPHKKNTLGRMSFLGPRTTSKGCVAAEATAPLSPAERKYLAGRLPKNNCYDLEKP